MYAKRFGPEMAIATTVAALTIGCENLPKVRVDFSAHPDPEKIALLAEQLDTDLRIAGSGVETVSVLGKERLVDFQILEAYMQVMADKEAREKYRNSILKTAETLHEDGKKDLSWRLLQALETSDHYYISALESR
ncbi:TPA: hypothetical protein DEP34_02925 [Candidatus Uhrbacteria bacterium]|uniref:Uncharacterized protein n=2 Tax=Candidatus Uhriibacteriota TaxID=1752732 RepID=A0A0G1SH24_9BACT|nr:MAG: hypothetical protein UX45_C0001G0028 [Candidatus Uhrbacteria bacterium GW2011_GWF2_46_218]KKU41408.1 MAG: hypothetical protein UX57_C0004G0112 [Candidatus Uhrbacteria bacterium GW2011_GWE2_46_68]HBK33844.1 hypothetical protein [Candidatus Uhrbacteria bacterium]HCB19316.1 hypothetical protein [Candidatus Uhrbacteria bacterium]